MERLDYNLFGIYYTGRSRSLPKPGIPLFVDITHSYRSKLPSVVVLGYPLPDVCTAHLRLPQQLRILVVQLFRVR